MSPEGGTASVSDEPTRISPEKPYPRPRTIHSIRAPKDKASSSQTRRPPTCATTVTKPPSSSYQSRLFTNSGPGPARRGKQQHWNQGQQHRNLAGGNNLHHRKAVVDRTAHQKHTRPTLAWPDLNRPVKLPLPRCNKQDVAPPSPVLASSSSPSNAGSIAASGESARPGPDGARRA